MRKSHVMFSSGTRVSPAPRIVLTACRLAASRFLAVPLLVTACVTSLAAEEDYVAEFTQLLEEAENQRTAGRFKDAELSAVRLKSLAERALAAKPEYLAGALNTLGVLYLAQGRYAEAEASLKQGLEIAEKVFPPAHPNLATILDNLGDVFHAQGRYAEAGVVDRQALETRKQARSPEHVGMASSYLSLGNLYKAQGRYAEAMDSYQQALQAFQKAQPPEHGGAAMAFDSLGRTLYAQGRYAEAETLFKQALGIRERAIPLDRPGLAKSLHILGCNCEAQGRQAEAERWYQRALDVHSQAELSELGLARTLHNLGRLCHAQGRYREAEGLLQKAVAASERAGSIEDRCWTYGARGAVRYDLGRYTEALADLRLAMQLAERVRAQPSGGEMERVTAFAGFAGVFDVMMAMQVEMDGDEEALETMERSRARTLLDQLELRNIDLLAGLPAANAARLRRADADAWARLREVQRQLELLSAPPGPSAKTRESKQQELRLRLRQAKQDVADVYARVRSASPAYRLAIGKDRKPVTMKTLQQWVKEQNALLLEYMIGWTDGYVLTVAADVEPRIHRLSVGSQVTEVLGGDPGPLTVQRLQAIINGKSQTGIVNALRESANPEELKPVVSRLALLWKVLIPEARRKALVDQKYQRLIIIPDGALAQLPFEALVVEPGENPKYLLDIAPPIQYAPSATILMNLAERQAEGVNRAAEPVLTVGDCRYGPVAQPKEETVLAQLVPQARYASLGGRLAPLPHSRTEALWISQVFGDKGTKVAALKGDQATEAAVRRNAPGRRVLHFACHGLVDQSYGNLFGALAFTPGPQVDDPANDGFLTLAEIYELDLEGCELAILSACETNVGPEQRGEGVWALSRGFLAAGSRRVVASNWLVDDEGAASLVSYFCALIAQAEKQGGPVDYAKALHDAKRWVRGQEKWKSPYYWGTFVLLGPS